MKKNQSLKAVAGFLLLFALYQSAEAVMRHSGNAALFLSLMGLMVAAAFGIARWLGFQGLGAWGLPWQRKGLQELGVAFW